MADLPKQLPPDVAAALSRGNVIEAIKLLHTKHNIGLAEAKNLLEALQQQARAGAAAATAARTQAHAAAQPMHAPHAAAVTAPPSHLSPGEVARTSSGALFAAVVVAIVFVIGAAIYFG